MNQNPFPLSTCTLFVFCACGFLVDFLLAVVNQYTYIHTYNNIIIYIRIRVLKWCTGSIHSDKLYTYTVFIFIFI